MAMKIYESLHDGFENTDKLCEKCEWTVHILRWDIEYKKSININPTVEFPMERMYRF